MLSPVPATLVCQEVGDMACTLLHTFYFS